MSTEKVKAAIQQTIGGIQQDPANAHVTFGVKTAWVNGVLTKVRARQFNFTVDEPESLGGTDLAPNPVEYLLASLGTCQEILYAAFAAVQGIPLTAVKVEVKGGIDLHGMFALKEGVPAGFREIEYHTVIESPAPKEVIEALVAAVESHCPVLDTLVNPVKVTGKVEIRQTELAI